MEQINYYWQTLANPRVQSQAELLKHLIDEADAVVIGIGAGMSAASGFTYNGERFTKNFPDFIRKYKFLDMLQASVFEFEDLQEYWAFHSRFSLLNYFDQSVGQTYLDLKYIIKNKNYHIITTNADNAFYAADFNMKKVFHIQGEYGLWQCSRQCYDKTYRDENLTRQMAAEQSDMKVPYDLIPYCPRCGAPLEVNKRHEEKGMVEDSDFHKQKERYEEFLKTYENEKVLFLEIGVGHTTPQFIKHPFQKMTRNNKKALFAAMNQKHYFIPRDIRPQSIRLDENISHLLKTAAHDKRR